MLVDLKGKFGTIQAKATTMDLYVVIITVEEKTYTYTCGAARVLYFINAVTKAVDLKQLEFLIDTHSSY